MKYLTVLLVILTLSCKNDKTVSENLDLVSKQVTYDSLEVYDFNGLKEFLYKQDDKTYVVNFWATWCIPCVKEMPHFEKLNREYKKENVEVILVSLDFPNQYEKKLKPFLEKNNIKSKVVALNDTDMDSWIPQVSENWSGSIPATLIYNKGNRIFYEQSFNYEELQESVKQFLN